MGDPQLQVIPPVKVSGTIVRDRNDRVLRFDAVHEISSESEDADRFSGAREALSGLKTLTNGWLDGQGVALLPVAVDNADRFLTALAGQQAQEPRVYPTPEGGVQFE